MVLVLEIATAEVAAVVGSIRVDPGDQFDELFAGELHVLVPLADQGDQFAGVGAKRVRGNRRGVARFRVVFSPNLDQVFPNDVLVRAAERAGGTGAGARAE